MGLDMPLNERTILKKENDSIMLVSGENTTYWQKGNAIHTYFEKTLKHKLKNYQDYKVTCDQLKNLLIIIDNVQSNHSIASCLLPTTQVFGVDYYDEGYFEDLLSSRKEIRIHLLTLSIQGF